jgi:hypothetical protein
MARAAALQVVNGGGSPVVPRGDGVVYGGQRGEWSPGAWSVCSGAPWNNDEGQSEDL